VVWCSAPAVHVRAQHAGNVFVEGESVRVDLPPEWGAWRAIDVDGNELAHGTQSGVELGKLSIGYFEIRRSEGPGRITAAVVAKNAPVDDTPIALDAAMSWFYADPQQIRDACRLCRLAGVTWVRDRLSWPELETARGVWAEDTRYERAMRIEHDEGLKILQVNHISPPRATGNPTRFPEDLRDVYNFYRGLAKCWHGLADAIEPWNEPDIDMFGGHTGCEIAAFHKAAALGLKAGDPDLPVSGTVFAIDRAETLDEFGANEVFPYFDRYHLHHYIGMPNYPRAYGRHRAVSGGRPMWTTEFNLPVEYADEQTKEPSDEELRVQAYRVGKVFATALGEGVEKAFYFILGDYVERGLQFGLVHHDLTPRPAYVAFAAVGRLLNGARPLGRVDFGGDKLLGYAFETVVDGRPQETLVAWSETHPTTVDVPQAETAFDYLGRKLPEAKKIKLTRETVFFILPCGGARRLKVTPPPAKPPWREGDACPVVLQLIGKGDSAQSAFGAGESNHLQLAAYNFGESEVHGRLAVKGGSCDAVEIRLAPSERVQRTINVQAPGAVTVELDLGALGRAIVSARVIQPPASTAPGS
jgi:hypothetical protein